MIQVTLTQWNCPGHHRLKHLGPQGVGHQIELLHRLGTQPIGKHALFQDFLAGRASEVRKYPWLEVNPDKFQGTFISLPERSQIPEKINEQLIVELYSK